MLEPFTYAFVQRGLVELVLLAVCGGLVGSFVVLRGLAFFTHAAGTATFPGLVLADGVGFSAILGAGVAALVFAVGVEGAARRRRNGYDSLTALVLVGALALGVILASDVYHSGSNVETLLFGSLLVIGGHDLVYAAAAAAAALVLTALLGRRWLALGFDPDYAHATGLRSPLPDAALLLLLALSATVSVSAVGSLLVTALFVVPAATMRLVTRRVATLQLGSVALVALEGVVGIWLSVEWNIPPGAAIAVLSSACFAVVAASVALGRRRTLVLPGLAALVLLAAGCGGGDGRNGGRLDVVAMSAVDRGTARCMARVPAAERKLVTDHDAFGYFARRYSITVVGAVIPSQTAQARPSARETAHLISLIRREHVKAVFPESSINARLAAGGLTDGRTRCRLEASP